MGKYFVTLAKQVGYERTILLLGRHLRFSTFYQHFFWMRFFKIVHQGFLSQPGQPSRLPEVHVSQGN